MFKLDISNQTIKDYKRAARLTWYRAQMAEILAVLQRDPFEPTPGHCFERLRNNMSGYCSRQINHGNRVLYKVLPNTANARDEHGNLYEGVVRVYRAWGHNYKKPND
ncbi:hypothetical protein R80B4_01746 [Fibrobacteres bacterium R8-0-B4]